MSQKPSHIPLFPDAYHRDTTHLTTEEHGAYLLLLMAAWGTEDCSLPNDERRLAALSKTAVQRWRKIAPTVLEFRSEEHTSELQSLMRISYAVFCLNKKKTAKTYTSDTQQHRQPIKLTC